MQADLNNISKVLEKMTQLELAAAELYEAAAAAFPDDAPFWSRLSRSEVLHAGYIGKIGAILMKKPEIFEAGRPFNITATDLFVTDLKKSTERLRKGGFNKRQILFMALDTEQAILESKYQEILFTKDIEYQTLVSEIVVETDRHKQLILDKIDETK